MNVLITSGGTEEPIDGVRYITNFSTGRTGAAIADRLTALGARVTLLHGKRASLPEKEMTLHSFTSFKSLDGKLKQLLSSGKFDAVIHLAAVSDYSVESIETDQGVKIEPDDKGKISSDNENLNLRLKRNYKILQKLKDYAPEGKNLLVVGFKLTDTDSTEEMEAAVKKQLSAGHVDFAVHNNLRDISLSRHPARIYVSDGSLLFRTETKDQLADKLYKLMKDKGY